MMGWQTSGAVCRRLVCGTLRGFYYFLFRLLVNTKNLIFCLAHETVRCRRGRSRELGGGGIRRGCNGWLHPSSSVLENTQGDLPNFVAMLGSRCSQLVVQELNDIAKCKINDFAADGR